MNYVEKIEDRIIKAVQIASLRRDVLVNKDYIIDQMFRALTGEKYDDLVKIYCQGESGSNTYEWETGEDDE